MEPNFLPTRSFQTPSDTTYTTPPDATYTPQPDTLDYSTSLEGRAEEIQKASLVRAREEQLAKAPDTVLYRDEDTLSKLEKEYLQILPQAQSAGGDMPPLPQYMADQIMQRKGAGLSPEAQYRLLQDVWKEDLNTRKKVPYYQRDMQHQIQLSEDGDFQTWLSRKYGNDLNVVQRIINFGDRITRASVAGYSALANVLVGDPETRGLTLSNKTIDEFVTQPDRETIQNVQEQVSASQDSRIPGAQDERIKQASLEAAIEESGQYQTGEDVLANIEDTGTLITPTPDTREFLGYEGDLERFEELAPTVDAKQNAIAEGFNMVADIYKSALGGDNKPLWELVEESTTLLPWMMGGNAVVKLGANSLGKMKTVQRMASKLQGAKRTAGQTKLLEKAGADLAKTLRKDRNLWKFMVGEGTELAAETATEMMVGYARGKEFGSFEDFVKAMGHEFGSDLISPLRALPLTRAAYRRVTGKGQSKLTNKEYEAFRGKTDFKTAEDVASFLQLENPTAVAKAISQQPFKVKYDSKAETTKTGAEGYSTKVEKRVGGFVQGKDITLTPKADVGAVRMESARKYLKDNPTSREVILAKKWADSVEKVYKKDTGTNPPVTGETLLATYIAKASGADTGMASAMRMVKEYKMPKSLEKSLVQQIGSRVVTKQTGSPVHPGFIQGGVKPLGKPVESTNILPEPSKGVILGAKGGKISNVQGIQNPSKPFKNIKESIKTLKSLSKAGVEDIVYTVDTQSAKSDKQLANEFIYSINRASDLTGIATPTIKDIKRVGVNGVTKSILNQATVKPSVNKAVYTDGKQQKVFDYTQYKKDSEAFKKAIPDNTTLVVRDDVGYNSLANISRKAEKPISIQLKDANNIVIKEVQIKPKDELAIVNEGFETKYYNLKDTGTLQDLLDPANERATQTQMFMDTTVDNRYAQIELVQEAPISDKAKEKLIADFRRMNSASVAEMRWFQYNLVDPLIKHVGESKISMEDFADYAYAVHAPYYNLKTGRNRVIEHLGMKDWSEAKKAKVERKVGRILSRYQSVLAELQKVAFTKDSLQTPAQKKKYDKLLEVKNRIEDLMQKKSEDESWGLASAWSKQALWQGSGMTTTEALQKQFEYQDKYNTADLRKGLDYIKEINNYKNQKQVNTGLQSPQALAQANKDFPYYVSLRDFKEFESNKQTTGKFRNKGGASVFKSAKGKLTQSQNVIGKTITDALEEIHNANKNKLARDFVDQVLTRVEGPWQVLKTPQKLKTDKGPGYEQFIEGRDFIQTHEKGGYKFDTKRGSDNTFTYRDGGATVHIAFADHPLGYRMQKAMSNFKVGFGNNAFGSAAKLMTKLTREMGQLKTSKNPLFIPRNFLRDTHGSINYIASHFGPKVAARVNNPITLAKVVSQVFLMEAKMNAGVNIWKANLNKTQSYYRDALMDGMKMDIMSQTDAENTQKELTKLAKNISKSVTAKVRTRSIKKYMNATFGLLSNAGDAVEQANRLSTYIYLREHGHSREVATFHARSVSTDFGVSGQYSQYFGLLTMFANAGIQGNKLYISLWANKKTRASIAALSAFQLGAGYMMAMYNHIMLGEDEEGTPLIFDMQDWLLENNITIPFGDKGLLAVPLQYGFSIPYALGVKAYRSMYDKKYSPAQAALETTLMAAETLDFTGMTTSIATMPDTDALSKRLALFLKVLAPAPIDPMLEVMANTNFFGGSVYPETRTSTDPKHLRTFKSTPEVWKQLALQLNKMSTSELQQAFGGIGDGWADIQPDILRFLANAYIGGNVQLLEYLSEIIDKDMNLEEALDKFPLVNQVAKDVDTATLWKKREKLRAIYKKVKRFDVAIANRRKIFDTPEFSQMPQGEREEVEASYALRASVYHASGMGIIKDRIDEYNKTQKNKKEAEAWGHPKEEESETEIRVGKLDLLLEKAEKMALKLLKDEKAMELARKSVVADTTKIGDIVMGVGYKNANVLDEYITNKVGDHLKQFEEGLDGW